MGIGATLSVKVPVMDELCRSKRSPELLPLYYTRVCTLVWQTLCACRSTNPGSWCRFWPPSNARWAGGLTFDHMLALGINALVQADANQVCARGIALSRRRFVRKNLRVESVKRVEGGSTAVSVYVVLHGEHVNIHVNVLLYGCIVYLSHANSLEARDQALELLSTTSLCTRSDVERSERTL